MVRIGHRSATLRLTLLARLSCTPSATFSWRTCAVRIVHRAYMHAASGWRDFTCSYVQLHLRIEDAYCPESLLWRFIKAELKHNTYRIKLCPCRTASETVNNQFFYRITPICLGRKRVIAGVVSMVSKLQAWFERIIVSGLYQDRQSCVCYGTMRAIHELHLMRQSSNLLGFVD